MATEFRDSVLDKLSDLGNFETKNMFGGTAVLREGIAFAKIKHEALWLKVNDRTKDDFIQKGMEQYTYGKDNSRTLNFYKTPADVLNDRKVLTQWANRAWEAAKESKGK